MNIKDYLHLYLGCEVQFLDRNNDIRIGAMVSYDTKNDFPVGINHNGFRYETNYDYEEFKPILRRVSDMTEEEAIEAGLFKPKKEWYDYNWNKLLEKIELIEEKRIQIEFTAEQTRKLLLLHIDLFGLIDAGVAIDKSTIK